MVTTVGIFHPDSKPRDTFTDEQYKEFRANYQKEAVPKMKDSDRKRARSAHASRSRWVD